MKRGVLGSAIVLLVAGLLTACGADNSGQSQEQPTAIPLPSSGPTQQASPSSLPIAGPEATAIPDGSRIIIDSPDAATAIHSPVEVAGTASVDGGNVVAVILDADGNELGRATTTATAVAPAFGHFDVNVSYSGETAGTKGQIKVFGVNPRNGSPTWYYFIAVRFS